MPVEQAVHAIRTDAMGDAVSDQDGLPHSFRALPTCFKLTGWLIVGAIKTGPTRPHRVGVERCR